MKTANEEVAEATVVMRELRQELEEAGDRLLRQSRTITDLRAKLDHREQEVKTLKHLATVQTEGMKLMRTAATQKRELLLRRLKDLIEVI